MLILALFSHQRDLKTFEVKEGRALVHRTATKCEDLSTRRKENGEWLRNSSFFIDQVNYFFVTFFFF